MRKKAAALAYEEYKDHAPKVVASGQGMIAEAIIKKANEFNIPLFCNAELVDSLVKMDINSNVPPELYQAVVDVFIWLQNAENKASISKNDF
ncbi:flagellar biosynthesis protein FlhB [Helicobacter saguini]|uniref:Flagellar biosynthesis protein FlhB n=1 Tax=Helicobacter saguini TaxID=1548018 RepID=A0A099BCI5_9HELI|nr:EscU/YscU/HrcU family type III secretion system export apparatus switch protein [Helicobacter saguini]MWV62905.1 flagellar biosynthesis protein FlhB [Helicobacter saguini]MWV66425.1 flagellar biosynthesis protein FlhB [Helicobacter saguini]MWV68776.1 flagellar biosynthesis protein FlhB [Helicobacter saguini]MWV71670.1 flagellar biosynthesis protein FlhB [Helicobacter saguini]TLD94471.1 flagellar biosynthesis protein FlhB [Helicobacter saguini]